jgi:hypothetical protein
MRSRLVYRGSELAGKRRMVRVEVGDILILLSRDFNTSRLAGAAPQPRIPFGSSGLWGNLWLEKHILDFV